MNRPKAIGTAAETAVVRYMRQHGWPNAERRALAGSTDLGDITGCPGLCVEVKGGKAAEVSADADLAAWFAQTDIETENSRAEIGLLVCKRKAVGPGNAGSWWAWLRLSDCSAIQTSYGVADPSTCPDHYVRMTLRQALWLLRHGGYGTPLHESP